jgi:FkbM family methyltransferase
MAFGALKSILPDRPMPVRIWRGPLRGGRAVMNPRNSLRKILGLYEHELNTWLEAALRLTDRVIDVGANDGYFTFGCAAAFQRLRKQSEIVAFEPEAEAFRSLSDGLRGQQARFNTRTPQHVEFTLVQSFVGSNETATSTTLDNIQCKLRAANDRQQTLIKIDVEGAEEDVLAGASSWLTQTNCFLIEVHHRSFLETIPQLFAAHGLQLDQIDQRPLKLIGRELRDEENWWLVSHLPSIGK